MTEQEIINELKFNRLESVAYLRLSEDVKVWIDNHINDHNLLMMTKLGDWLPATEYRFSGKDYMNVIFCLDDDYQLEPKSSGEWVEFEIINNRFFDYNDGNINRFFWFDFIDFLNRSYSKDWGFTTFGGWLYEPEKGNPWWETKPCFLDYEGCLDGSCPLGEESKPLIPKKIRFWREEK